MEQFEEQAPVARGFVPNEWKPGTNMPGFVKDWERVRDKARAPWRYAPSDAHRAEVVAEMNARHIARLHELMDRKHVSKARRWKLMRRATVHEGLVVEQPPREPSCTHKELIAGLMQGRPKGWRKRGRCG